MNNLTPPLPEPMPEFQRDTALDFLRGLAILGLIFSNLSLMKCTGHILGWAGIYGFSSRHEDMLSFSEPVEFALSWLVLTLIAGKCVAVLAFLLGAGMALIQEKCQRLGSSFEGVAMRRMGVLFCFGFLHSLLIWFGDILMAYALIGVALVLLAGIPVLALRLLAGALIVGTVILYLALLPFETYRTPAEAAAWLGSIGEPANGEEVEEAVEASYLRGIMEWEERSRGAYGSGSFWDALQARAVDAFFGFYALTMYLPFYIGLALLGVDAVRRGWLRRRLTTEGGLSPWWYLLGGCGVAISGLLGWWELNAPAEFRGVASLFLGFVLGGPLLGAFYVVFFLHLGRKLAQTRPVAWISCVGRAALSNYLLQSLVATTLLYNYGLGLFGQISYGVAVLLGIFIVILQLVWSRWWFRRFAFGPLELLWRKLSYPSFRSTSGRSAASPGAPKP